MANKLKNESSLYLKQHENNPVSWYPWGEEAFSKASNEDKPIFFFFVYRLFFLPLVPCHGA
jgi:uncharacterized protein YyaL (SSP411 family)